jgi:hypothetical protein
VFPTISTSSTYSVNAPGVSFRMPHPLRGVGEYSLGWLGTVGVGTVVAVVVGGVVGVPGPAVVAGPPDDGTLGCDPDGDPTVGGTQAVTASAAALAATIVSTFRRPAFIVISFFLFGFRGGWTTR